MKRSIVILTAAAFAIPLSAQGGKEGKGGAIFQEICASCHGNDGRGQTDMGKELHAADLTSSVVQQKSDSDLAKSVKNGKGKMPALGEKLSDDDIRAVIKHVRQFDKK